MQEVDYSSAGMVPICISTLVIKNLTNSAVNSDTIKPTTGH